MEKVPQIVIGRLKATSASVNHPDADLLTAFSERTLLGTEQAFVMEHLAKCGECRDIVALALPAAEAVQEFVRPSKTDWFTWPVIRWGAVAAGVVLVGSFGIVEYQHRHEARANFGSTGSGYLDKEAKNVAPPVPTETPDQDKAQNTSSEQDQPTNGTSANKSKSAAPSPSAPMLVREHPPIANLQHGPRVQFQQNATFQNQAAGSLAAPSAPERVPAGPLPRNSPVPAQSEAVEVAAGAPAAKNETANLDAGLAPLSSQADSRQFDSRVERSKPATQSVMTTAQASAAHAESSMAAPAAKSSARVVVVNPASTVIWGISPAGALQKSFDQGSTWQDVDINGRADSSLQASIHGAAKQAANDALKKDAQSVFRAVASNGPDVWAGASGGLLYHSTDAGAHWTRVVPSSLGASLSGDIVSLEFPDLQHGRAVTAAPEVWTTSDGGQTWQKQ